MFKRLLDELSEICRAITRVGDLLEELSEPPQGRLYITLPVGADSRCYPGMASGYEDLPADCYADELF